MPGAIRFVQAIDNVGALNIGGGMRMEKQTYQQIVRR